MLDIGALCEHYEINKSQYIELFLAFLKKTESEYMWSIEKEKEQDDLTQDILHCLELEDIGYHERARLAKYLAETRQERRKYKDTVEELKPIVEFIHENKKMLNIMEQLLGIVRKQEKRHKNRKYCPKVFNWKSEGKASEDA